MSMRLIDADAAVERLQRRSDMFHFDKRYVEDIRDAIGEVLTMPTIDPVPVVRCACCVLHDHCTVEDMFILAGFNDGYCRAGKRLSNAVSGAKMDGEAD